MCELTQNKLEKKNRSKNKKKQTQQCGPCHTTNMAPANNKEWHVTPSQSTRHVHSGTCHLFIYLLSFSVLYYYYHSRNMSF
jgi:hypothetical protein